LPGPRVSRDEFEIEIEIEIEEKGEIEMTKEDVLQKLYTQIAAFEDQSGKLLAQKQQAQSTLDGIGAQRQKLLAALGAGDTTVVEQLDSLDAQETALTRQVQGIGFIIGRTENGAFIPGTNDAAIADLRAQAAPLEAQMATEQFHQDAGEETDAMDACADELEQILELGANKLAEFTAHSTRIYTTCGERPDGVDYRNRCNLRAEKLGRLVRLNLTNGVWQRLAPIHPKAFVPAVLEIFAAISPDVASKVT
jgi:uncharacterized protein YukE